MQSQVVCSGCRNVLIYPRGSNSVCCAFCNAITSILPPPPTPTMPNTSMDQLICGGCRTLLMYARGATSVRCSCCHTHNLAPPTHNLAPPTPATYAHINCGNCRTTLMYPSGALSVKCSLCQYITNVNMNNGRVPIPMHQPGAAPPSGQMPSASTGLSHSQSQTVVVENPMSVDKSGKLVSNVVVGVTTEKK